MPIRPSAAAVVVSFMLDAGFSARSPSLMYSQRPLVASNTANAVPGPP